MTKVIFSFDTENYIDPAADEGVLRLARTLEEEGVRGCFCVVGELAATWRRRNRRDVLEALRPHEVDAHSWRHTWHPNIAEYSENPDWHASLARFLREERYAIDLVMDVCQRDRIWAAIKPGNSLSAQGIYGYTLLGAPIFGDGILDARKGRGMWFCNALNLTYDFNLENPLTDRGLQPYRERLNEWATWERLILYAHPCKTVLAEFWDGVNLREGNPPWGQWAPAQPRPRAVVEKLFADLRALIRMLKEHGGFEFETYEDVWRQHRQEVRRELDKERLLRLLRGVRERFTWQADPTTGETYTPAELFAAAVAALAGRDDPWGAWGVMGPVYEPKGIAEPLSLAAEEVRAAARRLEPITYVPATIEVGRVTLGPADMLCAMAQVLDGAPEVRLAPQPQLPEAVHWPQLDTWNTAAGWLHPRGWTSMWVDNRLRWQSWTVRPA